MSLQERLARLIAPARKRCFPLRPDFPPGFRIAAPLLESLSDHDLRRLNELLDWNCYLLDGRGRRFGNIARPGKRMAPEQIPDRRIRLLDERFGLEEREVLELGCFEGIHTAGLCALGARVTAVDARVDHVVKTIVRCSFLGHFPAVFTCNLENPADCQRLPRAELLHHVGVLYHLADPVTHLRNLHRWATVGVMLDTHYAEKGEATGTYEVGGKAYPCSVYREAGAREAFSGMRAYSRWLTLDTIFGLLTDSGFPDVEVVERRAERNGPRALLFARRAPEQPGSDAQSSA